MGKLTKLARTTLKALTGLDVQRFGSKAMVIMDGRVCHVDVVRDQYGDVYLTMVEKKRRTDAWMSYVTQFETLIRQQQIDLVVDVGANDGAFVRSIRPIYAGKIISFEPVREVFQRLRQNADGDGNWIVQNLALGSVDTNQTIHVAGETVFSSLLRTNEYCAERFGELACGAREETVSVRRLDGVLPQLIPDFAEARILLKLDTQGYDIEVFRGLGDVLERVVAIQSEVSLIPIYENAPHWTDSIETYEAAGFQVFGLFPVSRDSGRVIEYDCLMSRASSVRTPPMAGH